MNRRVLRSVMLGLVACLVLSAASASARTTITIWSWSDAVGQWMADNAAEFNQSQSDIEVIVEQYPFDGYFDKVKLSVAGGIGPDLVRATVQGTDAPYPGDFYRPSLVEYMYEQASQLPFYEDFVLESGEVYGIPWVVWPSLLWYNVDLLAESGYGQAPKTWDELADMAQKLTRISSDGTIIQSGYAMEGEDFQQVFLAQASPDFYKVGDREVKLSGTGAEDAYQFMLNLKGMNIFDWPAREWAGDKLAHGRAAMIFMGSWLLGHMKNFPEINWDVAPQPRPNENAPYGMLAVASDLRFSAGLDEAKRAAGAEFLRFLFEEEQIAEVTQTSGLLPARLEYYQSSTIMHDENIQKLLRASEAVLPNSVGWLQGTAWDAVMESISSVIYFALDNDVHPAQAMQDIEFEAKSRLEAYYSGQ